MNCPTCEVVLEFKGGKIFNCPECFRSYLPAELEHAEIKIVDCHSCPYLEKRGKNYKCNWKKCNMGPKPFYRDQRINLYAHGFKTCNYIKKEINLKDFV